MPNLAALHLMVALSLPLALATAAAGETSASPGPSSPTAAIHALARAYTDRSLETYAALLSADYRFHFNATGQTYGGIFVDGFAREDELKSTSALFNGVVRQGRVVLPAARTLTATLDSLEERPDPEHPDSTAHYRIVAAHRFRLLIDLADRDTILTAPSLHVFHLVRGDAAVRVEGQPADPGRWYVRRWLEDVDGVTLGLAANRGDCGEPAPRPGAPGRSEGTGGPSGGSAGVPVRLAIHPLGNPACPTMDLTCDLPGNEPALLDVFDVMGRIMNHRELPVSKSGTVKVEAGAGARIVPGVYWVRLSQGARPPTTKMVVVAR